MESNTDNTLHQFCNTLHLLCDKLPHATVYRRQLLTETDAQILMLNFDYSSRLLKRTFEEKKKCPEKPVCHRIYVLY